MINHLTCCKILDWRNKNLLWSCQDNRYLQYRAHNIGYNDYLEKLNQWIFTLHIIAFLHHSKNPNVLLLLTLCLLVLFSSASMAFMWWRNSILKHYSVYSTNLKSLEFNKIPQYSVINHLCNKSESESHVWLCDPMTMQSMEFSRWEYWSG